MTSTDTTQNLDVFDAPDVVNAYAAMEWLQDGERAVLKEFAKQWSSTRLLDIGIGGGRTTHHFAPLVKEYIGTDYAPNMIDACRKRFDSRGGRVRFEVCDARKMDQFSDGEFDFVCFSYNGIDCVPHDDRMAILREIHRVLRPGGHFFFSSHNLRYFPRLFRFPLFLDVAKMKRRLKKYRLLREHNPNWREIAKQRHAFVPDGVHEFRVKIYYVDPEEQLAQLQQTGFNDTRLLAETGEDVPLTSPRLQKDNWVHYLCRK
jgi:ubiquinone/menaquinone biosynthesis C-methylase UbiE